MTRTEAEMTVHMMFKNTAFKILRKDQGGCCAYCGCDFVPLTLEHIVPLSKGGDPYRLDNLVVACIHCNQAKGSYSWQQFRRWLNYVKYEYRGVPAPTYAKIEA